MIRTPFLENLFIVNHKRSHKFLSVAKVGSTTVKYVTAADDNISVDIDEPQKIHDEVFGVRPNTKTMVRVNSERYPEYTRVMPYRDPVDRVTSWYKDKILGLGSDTEFFNYYVRLDLINEKNYDRILEFVKFEITKPHNDWIDQHLRPLTKYASEEQVDVIVLLQDLDKYLEHVGCQPSMVPEMKRNSTKAVSFAFPKRIQRKIRKFYKDDYTLIKKSKKIWTPPAR